MVCQQHFDIPFVELAGNGRSQKKLVRCGETSEGTYLVVSYYIF